MEDYQNVEKNSNKAQNRVMCKQPRRKAFFLKSDNEILPLRYKGNQFGDGTKYNDSF